MPSTRVTSNKYTQRGCRSYGECGGPREALQPVAQQPGPPLGEQEPGLGGAAAAARATSPAGEESWADPGARWPGARAVPGFFLQAPGLQQTVSQSKQARGCCVRPLVHRGAAGWAPHTWQMMGQPADPGSPHLGRVLGQAALVLACARGPRRGCGDTSMAGGGWDVCYWPRHKKVFVRHVLMLGWLAPWLWGQEDLAPNPVSATYQPCALGQVCFSIWVRSFV